MVHKKADPNPKLAVCDGTQKPVGLVFLST